MITYKEFFNELLLREYVSQRVVGKISNEKIESVKNKLFSEALSHPAVFYRKSLQEYNPPFIDPKKIQRTSKDTFNLYYIIMDTFPAWSGWPSRSQSVIFTNSLYEASEYDGIMYKVYPANNAKIAWGGYEMGFLSFPYLESLTERDLPGFLRSFRLMIREIKKAEIPLKITKSEWGDISVEIDDFFKKHDWSSETNLIIFNKKMRVLMKESYEKGLGINDILDDLFDPIKNSFKMGSVGDAIAYFQNSKAEPREIWTNHLCYVETKDEKPED